MEDDAVKEAASLKEEATKEEEPGVVEKAAIEDAPATTEEATVEIVVETVEHKCEEEEKIMEVTDEDQQAASVGKPLDETLEEGVDANVDKIADAGEDDANRVEEEAVAEEIGA